MTFIVLLSFVTSSCKKKNTNPTNTSVTDPTCKLASDTTTGTISPSVNTSIIQMVSSAASILLPQM